MLHGVAVFFTISPVAEPKRRYEIQLAFSAEQLGLAEHIHLVRTLQRKYRHLDGLPLQSLNGVHPVLLIGSDCTHLITPIEPVRLALLVGQPLRRHAWDGLRKAQLKTSSTVSLCPSASSLPHLPQQTCSHMWRSCGRWICSRIAVRS